MEQRRSVMRKTAIILSVAAALMISAMPALSAEATMEQTDQMPQ